LKHCLSSTGSFDTVEEWKEGRAKLPGKGDTTGEADIAKSSLENLCLIFLLSKMSLTSFLHPAAYANLELFTTKRNRV